MKCLRWLGVINMIFLYSVYSLRYKQFDFKRICGSSLIYNTSVRHEWYKCNTSDTNATRVQHEGHEWDTNNLSATRVLHERHECNTSATRTTRVRHERKKIDFDNDTSENIFSHPFVNYVVSERLQGEKQFHSVPLKSAPQKLNFVMANTISKS